ncbi:alpha/beta fold hydrolase [Flavobacterium subsaxonicum]|uniref:Hydrolase n=1 Tax=Flavobacterium subsaxonicum WB 4.1-42 = DSM 21790 TaxID=1121898 RepID=A0A0A2MUD0_9FLAO|nr:alpha/beta hydrolase [Flavobacterium subsaxonicum]KGO91830.1 hydrolase [Flavobacterium subsaxonicum WB 4.1-42 = DSM 21790]
MKTSYHSRKINGVEIFYREAGDKQKPTVLLLHGYPTSSHMFRNLINDLADDFHLIAPDYPGYGRSEQPPMAEFDYTFENLSNIMKTLLDELGIKKFSLYLMDYGAPIGFRIASRNPDQVETLIIQNGCAYEEGLQTFWDPIKEYWIDRNNKVAENTLRGFHDPNGLHWQYTHAVPDPNAISPDNWEIDLRHLERPENGDIQLAMFYDYQTNVVLYPEWQQYFRNYQPETIIVYGKDDYIFPGIGAEAFKKDLKNLEFHLFNTGHFALESYGDEIGALIKDFLLRKTGKSAV